ncbi:excalibur calcium-binding domain-containing protein [Psychromonas sp. 14N.309.X.WAT.B.A12]|uniref:excalibur calcium-binding domain-containing protein n=1 Tax=unclassified Psychromonas TaxID=2614957 RepID=UPI0025B04F80|nr:excalibur calcium-binding domain-containing protein [Psychromonas sp. 14N.309.X.WAT.B.A12]MDN2664797.1 excalibur calcium-binding domain-containing protein [Psychromonas sp. 14N.309.X.WAT.B.A12]
MKKLLILILIGIAANQIYQKYNVPVITNADIEQLNKPVKLSNFKSHKQQYSCDGRQYCSEMHSCEEATFFIEHCPNTKMDGNHDGVPCERQWCN